MIVWLFVPGYQPERIRKAFATDADRVIVDWEDAVAPTEKANARAATGQVLAELGAPERFVIRINPPGSEEHAEDIEAVARIRPGAVMQAKTETAEDLLALTERGLIPVPLIESALGLEQAHAIARAPGVSDMAFGYIDFLADTHATYCRESLLYARSRLVTSARAAGLHCLLDGPMSALDDHAALTAEAAHVRSLGFNGKLAIHPRQVQALRRHFRPSADEMAEAREIIRVYREGLRQGRGAVRHGGIMIDGAVAKQAERILEAAGQ